MDHFRAMQVFVRVADKGSLSAASADMGYARGVASAIVSDLERYLGVQLLERTTRRLRLTEEGEIYLKSARRILMDVSRLEDEVGSAERHPRGVLRVQMPAGLTRLVVAPGLPRFCAAYPDIELQILSRNSIPDFVGDGIDAAVVVGDLPDLDIIARPAGTIPYLTAASPDYLAQHGMPACPADLSAHRCLPVLSTATWQPVPWRFRQDGQDVQVQVTGSLSFEAAEAAVAAALRGAGILQLASYLVWEDLANGRLRPVLHDMRPAPSKVHIVHSRHRLKPRKLRLFEEFLLDQRRRMRERYGDIPSLPDTAQAVAALQGIAAAPPPNVPPDP